MTPDESKTLSESQSAEAVNATAVAEEAKQKAAAAQIAVALEVAMERFFNRGVDEKRFVDIGRIPFICDDIRGIHGVLIRMDNTLSLVSKIVYGFIGVILIGVMGVVGTVILTVLSAK